MHLRAKTLVFFTGMLVLLQGTLLAVPSDQDQTAVIFSFTGDVKIMKANGTGWQTAAEGMRIHPGDQLLTGKESSVEIAYDDKFLNIAKIEENTKAEFKSIEPTDLYLEDGTIFNAIDGLTKGHSYQVSTPIAVSAVRGTHFDAMFDADTNQASFAVFPDPDPNASQLVVAELDPQGNLGDHQEIGEGSQLDMTNGEMNTHAVDPERQEQAQQSLESMNENTESFQSENPPAPQGESEDKAAGQTPPGGGGGEGGAQSSQGSEAQDAADAVTEEIIPEELPAETGGTPGQNGPDASAGEKQGETGEQNQEGSGSAPKAYTDALGSFLSVGSEGESSFDKEAFTQQATEVLQNLGFEDSFASDFGSFMGNYVETGGELDNFLGGAEFTPETMGALDSMMEGEVGDAFAEMDITMAEANQLVLDFGELARLVTEQGIAEQHLVDLLDHLLAEVNPFYLEVLEILENNLSWTDKQMLISTGHGTEIAYDDTVTCGGSYCGPVFGNVSDEVDHPGNERIMGVRYFNEHGDVHAEYTHILNQSGSLTVQAVDSEPYLILSPDACKSGDQEPGVC